MLFHHPPSFATNYFLRGKKNMILKVPLNFFTSYMIRVNVFFGATTYLRTWRGKKERYPDAASERAPPVRPSSTSADPSWQPRIALRRVDDAVVRPETRPGKPTDVDGHHPDQPEVARPGAVTRSGRISRPPLWFGLGGDAAD